MKFIKILLLFLLALNVTAQNNNNTYRLMTGGGTVANWTTSTVDPPTTGNGGILPRFVDNTTNGKKWYIDGTGTAKELGSGTTPLNPQLVPVRDFKTSAEITALTGMNDGDSYIVTDGAQKGNIATWDEATGTWIYFTPSNNDVTTITNPSNPDNQGKWQFTANLSNGTAGWIQVEQGIIIPDPIVRPISAGNLAWGRTNAKMKVQYVAGNAPAYVQNDRIAFYGNNQNFTSGGAGGDGAIPKKISWNWWNNVPTAYTQNGGYVPKFVDVDHSLTVMLAIDEKGKVWATGSQINGTGLTTTPLGNTIATGIPNYGLNPIPFFQARTDLFASRVFVQNTYYGSTNTFSAVLCTNGELYTTGYNGHGQMGQGNVTSPQPDWKKYTISNVIDVKLSTYNIFTLTATGDLYVSGIVASPAFSGMATNQTTPSLLQTNVKDFDFQIDNGNSVTNIMVVKNDGKLWGIGANSAGQLGLGYVGPTLTWKQVPNINNAKRVYCSKLAANGYSAVIKTDGTIAFSGQNTNGCIGYAPNANNAQNLLHVTPSFAAQGTISDALLGYQCTHVLTASGDVWNTGNTNYRGLGFADNTWATNMNKWQKVPLAEPALDIRGWIESTTNQEAFNALTANHGIIAWGMQYPAYTTQTGPSSQYFSPREIVETGYLDNGITLGSPLKGIGDQTGTITSITSGTIDNILDGGANVFITASLVVSGTVGAVDISSATLTGTGITSSLVTTKVYLASATNNSIKVTFKVSATDLIASGGADQTQNWTVTIGSATYSLSSIRTNDAVFAFMKNGSIAAYQSALAGNWIPVTESEYFDVINYVQGASKVGAVDNLMYTQGTNAGNGNLYSQAVLGTGSAGTLPANHYLIAYKSFAGVAGIQTIHFGNNTVPSSATYVQQGGGNNVVVGGNWFVRKTPNIQANAGVIGLKASVTGAFTYTTATAPTTSNYGPAAGSTTPTSWAQNVIQLQGVYTLTKPY